MGWCGEGGSGLGTITVSGGRRVVGGRNGGWHSFALTLYSKTVFTFRQVLTLHGASLEPDVACFSANFEGLQVQEVAFSSKTFEQVKVIPPFFKGAEDVLS